MGPRFIRVVHNVVGTISVILNFARNVFTIRVGNFGSEVITSLSDWLRVSITGLDLEVGREGILNAIKKARAFSSTLAWVGTG